MTSAFLQSLRTGEFLLLFCAFQSFRGNFQDYVGLCAVGLIISEEEQQIGCILAEGI